VSRTISLALATAATGVIALACGLPIAATLALEHGTGSCLTAAVPSEPATTAGTGRWSATQVHNATLIVAAGQHQGVSPRGWVIAIATAIQESTLHDLANPDVPASMNLPHDGTGEDHDSVGLFQQRPSSGWGTVTQLMDPATAAGKFYTALLRIPNWQTRPLTAVAQQVQGSAYPDAYAKWETAAGALVAAVAHVASLAQLPGADLTTCPSPAPVSQTGWTVPIRAPISSPFGPRDGGFHAGVDLAGARDTAIRAAAAGTVTVARCDPATGDCDHDGSGSVAGCGWYVEIRHPAGVVTRYCHLIRQPIVHVGQTVTAGQVIGAEGASGNATGPHLHFEVHLGVAADTAASDANATDPVPFMRQHGAPLGTEPTST
jgi:murein DD-endopeptidase MepM/ murein hydrolase activator NlpD